MLFRSKQVCENSRTMVTAEGEGVVEYVDATTIRILYDRTEDEEFVSFEPALKEYCIPKFRRTNQNMTIDLRPICNKGQRVKKGDILTEGYATENGELALGRNLLVAYMPWKGYNYEDAIVLNERIVREDVLTSVHVDEYSLDVRETKRGMEEFTSDIPNVSEEATKDLDENAQFPRSSKNTPTTSVSRLKWIWSIPVRKRARKGNTKPIRKMKPLTV